MNISLKELKNNLSSLLKRVANGEIVVATKHNKPYISIVPVSRLLLTIGENFGKKRLKNKIKLSEKLPSPLIFLQEDRNE